MDSVAQKFFGRDAISSFTLENPLCSTHIFDPCTVYTFIIMGYQMAKAKVRARLGAREMCTSQSRGRGGLIQGGLQSSCIRTYE